MFRVKTKGQSTLEYVILLGFVVAALIAMGVYMKRGMQGRLRESTDQVGGQYSAVNFTSEYDTDTSMVQNEDRTHDGKTTTNISTNEQIKKGKEAVTGFVPGE